MSEAIEQDQLNEEANEPVTEDVVDTDSQTEDSVEETEEIEGEISDEQQSEETAEQDEDLAEQAEQAEDSAVQGERAEPAEDAPEISTESVVEAILMATDTPMPASKIAQIVGVGNAKDVKKHIEALNEHYEQTDRSFRIEEIAKGFQILTMPQYNTWLSKVLKIRSESKLSPAAMETLAIIAYKQPVLRADVEAIRGVAAGDMINRLREMNLVKIAGRAEEVGRPMLYGTTARFLEVFGLSSLEDLPNTDELTLPGSN